MYIFKEFLPDVGLSSKYQLGFWTSYAAGQSLPSGNESISSKESVVLLTDIKKYPFLAGI